MKTPFRSPRLRAQASFLILSVLFAAIKAKAASQLMDYYKPTPIVGSLCTTCWGAQAVGPRDQSNGLEDKTLAHYVYWDGSIVKESDTLYHMYASRWDQALGHNGWQGGSHCMHATSRNLIGPYTDQGLCFTDNGGVGHNVGFTQLRADDPAGKKYAITLSGGVPGNGRIYGANSLGGPWTYLGGLSFSSGFDVFGNLQVILRPDGKYEAINSGGVTAIADNFLGPYKPNPSFYPGVVGIPDKGRIEDPTIWYGGGKYHWVCNEWDIVKAFHFTSLDGVTNWKLEPGHAYDASANWLRYTDGTVDHWAHYERPRPYLENGHIVAFTFAALNSEKDADKGNDQNGSKIVVVPFDGQAFDSDSICAGFYPESNYGGLPVTLKPGTYTTAQLSAAGIPDNSVSSIWVTGGVTVEIYANDNFAGTKSTLISSAANLASLNLNDAISSVKITAPSVGIKQSGKGAFAGAIEARNSEYGKSVAYDVSGRAVGNKGGIKSAIHPVRKADHHRQGSP